MTKQEESTEQLDLDKALTEMDVLATEDRNIFRVDTDTFRFQKIEYKLIEDHKEAFDIEMMEARFIDYLLKYDYIVGDIAYEKLRLRGFYDDQRKGVPIDMKISNLEDYLVEYCSFGCPYFVFERVDKKKADPESYFKRNKKTNRNRKGQSSRRRNQQNQPNQQNQQNKNQPKKQNQPKKKQPNKKVNHKNTNTNKPKQNAQKDFQVVKKETPKANKPQTKNASQKEQPKPKKNKKQFEIRKKKDE